RSLGRLWITTAGLFHYQIAIRTSRSARRTPSRDRLHERLSGPRCGQSRSPPGRSNHRWGRERTVSKRNHHKTKSSQLTARRRAVGRETERPTREESDLE